MDQFEYILTFWFGKGEESEIPSLERTALWFSDNKFTAETIKDKFIDTIEMASKGEYNVRRKTPRGCLALILLLDVFPRKIYPGQVQSFIYDHVALDVCKHGLKNSYEHNLCLIERVFFYMPLQRVENLDLQRKSIAAYKMLLDLAIPETKDLYQSFLKIAVYNFEVIKQFGRFPDRNSILNRKPTEAEEQFLKKQSD